LLALLLLACAEPRDPAPVLALTGDAGRGEAQYQMRCASCHGASGSGVSRTPALVGRVGQLSDAELVSVMLNGKGAMTRQSGLSDQHTADLLAYLRKAFR
jgi:mono/diheme cytochrome c family protein